MFIVPFVSNVRPTLKLLSQDWLGVQWTSPVKKCKNLPPEIGFAHIGSLRIPASGGGSNTDSDSSQQVSPTTWARLNPSLYLSFIVLVQYKSFCALLSVLSSLGLLCQCIAMILRSRK